MTPADARNLVFANVHEDDWQAQVRSWARFAGWLEHITYDSRRSPEGYPDLTLLHPKRGKLAFIELKTMTGRLTPTQRAWQSGLWVMASSNIIVAVWRPVQGDAVRNFLLGLPGALPPPSLPEPVRLPRVHRRRTLPS